VSAAIPSHTDLVRYVPAQFAPVQATLLRARAAVCLVVAIATAGVIAHSVVFRPIWLQNRIPAVGPLTEAEVRLFVSALLFAFTIRTALDYIFFLKKGGFLRVLPQGLQFRDRCFRLRTIAWSDLASFPSSEEIKTRDPDGRTRTIQPRVGFGVVERMPLADALGYYRPDLAADEACAVLLRILESQRIIDPRKASEHAEHAPETMTILLRSKNQPNLYKADDRATLSPDGLTLRGPFRWSKTRTLPWSVFSGLWVVDDFPGFPEPCLVLWREPFRADRMVLLPLEGVEDRYTLLAAIYGHRPDLDPIRTWEGRIRHWQGAM
jgi:hypothetical protein